LSADGETRHRLAERVDEAYLAVRIKKSEGKGADWACASVQLAEALTALASEEEDREAFGRYEQAINAYNQALEVLTAEAHLSKWGEAVVSFARALRSYAAREGGHMSLLRLDHADDLLGDVIAAMPEGKGQFDCAMLHIELAYVCRTKATIDREEKRLGHLHEAVAHFKQAVKILRTKESFDNWAIAVVGQATTWRDIAALNRHNAMPVLLKARDALKAVLSYYTAKTHPVDWVFSNFEYGRIWLRIALLREGEPACEAAKEAVSALRVALSFIVMENAPDLWLRLRTELALALTTLASVSETDEAFRAVEEAAGHYRILSGWYEEHGDAIGFAMMQANLGKELDKLAGLSDGGEALAIKMQAVSALRKSVPPLMEQELPDEWLTNMFELAASLHGLLQHHELPEIVSLREEAVSVHRKCIKHMDVEKNPAACAMLQGWLGQTLAALGERDDSESGLARLREAELCFRQALSLRHEREDSGDFIRLENNLGHLFYSLARRSGEAQARDYCDQALRSIMRARDLADIELNPEEWCSIQSNYAMVLLHRIRRNLSTNITQDCELGAQAFRSCIEIADKHIGIVSQLFLRRNLAMLLSLWARHVEPAEAYAHLCQSHGLLIEIRNKINEHQLKNMEDVVEECDIEEIETALENCRPRKPLERLLAWLFRGRSLR